MTDLSKTDSLATVKFQDGEGICPTCGNVATGYGVAASVATDPDRGISWAPLRLTPCGHLVQTVIERPSTQKQALIDLFADQQVGASIPPNLLGSYRRTLADAVLKLMGAS